MTTTGFGPPRRDTTSPRGTAPSAAGGPSRRLVIGSVGGALVAGSFLGLVLGVVSPQVPAAPTEKIIGATSPTATSGPAPRASALASGPSPSSSAIVTTAQAVEVSPPQARIDPAGDRSLKFVRLEDIRRDDQGRIVLRATSLTYSGGKAKRAGGKQGEYTLRDDATIFGEYFLGDHTTVQQNRFERGQAYDLLREALDHGQKPTFWIKRTLRTDGPVIYLAEQYVADK